jgi:hypothetical protein
MGQITDEYRKIISGVVPDEEFFVPLFRWLSGSIYNIEMCQAINYKFKYANRKVLIGELLLNNRVKHFMKFPSASKEESDIEFFYDDVCRFFGWTRNELRKTIDLLDIPRLSETIAMHYAYDNRQRKLIGLTDLGCFKDGKGEAKSRGILKERGNNRAGVQSSTKRSKDAKEGISKITDFG